MRIWTIAMALALFAAPAQAQQITADQDVIAAELTSRGYSAELIGDDREHLRTSDSGVPITIFFAHCDSDNRGCKTVQFYAGFTDIEPTLQQMNDWNAKQRWVRTYIDAEGDPVLEMDLNMDYGGLSRDLFWDNVKTFLSMVGVFRKDFGTN